MIQTSNVARLAGAAFLVATLAAWGLFTHLASGTTTVATWALGLAVLVPVSALVVGVAADRDATQTGIEYGIGLVLASLILSVAYLGVLAADTVLTTPIVGIDPLSLTVAAVAFSLLGVTLSVVDARYVERPDTVARLEDRYLDEPI